MPNTIIVGYDFSDCSTTALDEALRQAGRSHGSRVHVIMALEASHTALFPDIEINYEGASTVQARLSETVHQRAQQRAPKGITLFVHVRLGDPAQEILALAAEAEADLIVVGTHGHSGIKRLLVGSVAEKVVRTAQCPVVIARPKEYDQGELESPEPPCKLCVETRWNTNGAEWWCDIHSKPYVPPHRYFYTPSIVEMRPDDQPLW